VKALAVAAQKCFEHYRPGGMKVHAGSVILEPTLNGNDLGEIAKKGVWLAKAGFGAFKTAFEYTPLVAAARAHGMITTCHTGGSSIPGSGAITGDHLLAMQPHVSFHVNGGPTAMPDKDFERIIVEGDMALQVCTAGNLRTTLLCASLAQRHDAFDRLIVATDTPTGSGVMPLGMLYTISHLASLAGVAPELCIAAATGSNARVYRLESGRLALGKAADIVLIDAPDGGTQDNALAAIRNGDIAAVGAVMSGGEPRFVGRSRNTPATTRNIRVARCSVRAISPVQGIDRMTDVVDASQSFSPRQFREALGCFATGIAVVTAVNGGERIGATVSSFNSVSLDPPLVLFSMARSSAPLRPGRPWSTSRSTCWRSIRARRRRDLRARSATSGTPATS